MKRLLLSTAIVTGATFFHLPAYASPTLTIGEIIHVTAIGTPDNAAFYAATTNGYNYYTGPVTLTFQDGTVTVFCADMNHILQTVDYQVGLLTRSGAGTGIGQIESNLLGQIAAFGLSHDNEQAIAAQALIWDREYNTTTTFADSIAHVDFDALNLPASLANLASLNDGTYAVALIPYGTNWPTNADASQQMIVGTFAFDVPEPASIALFSVGLLGTVAFARRRRRRA